MSRDLETHQGLRNNDVTKSKEEILKDVGINKMTANRYEELTGGREEQAQNVAIAAADAYLTSDSPEPGKNQLADNDVRQFYGFDDP